jgi:heme/copper-type cytochrome/quinol oxidase subunit 3
MSEATIPPGTQAPVFYETDEHHHDAGGSTMLGFWLYLMSDCLIFAMLFAAYGVYGGSYAGGPQPHETARCVRRRAGWRSPACSASPSSASSSTNSRR